MNFLDKTYWNSRYTADNTPWDAGSITRPIKEFVDQIENKDLRILIPGAGNAHEAKYLHEQGFSHVIICDWAEEAVRNFFNKLPDFPEDHAVVSDFFDLEPAYDLILEQTFFCALPPELRDNYAAKVAELLTENGQLAGLLFKELPVGGPPFGGNKEEYMALFSRYFDMVDIEDCYNSISPRAGKELFISISGKKQVR